MWLMATVSDSTDLVAGWGGMEYTGGEGSGQELVSSLVTEPSLTPTLKHNFISTSHCLGSDAC